VLQPPPSPAVSATSAGRMAVRSRSSRARTWAGDRASTRLITWPLAEARIGNAASGGRARSQRFAAAGPGSARGLSTPLPIV